MNVLFNNERLLRLISNLHTLTGIWANIFDENGKDIQIIGSQNPFCQRINATPEGHARCEACDAAAVKKCSALRRCATSEFVPLITYPLPAMRCTSYEVPQGLHCC